MKNFIAAADRFEACLKRAAMIVGSYRAQAPVGFDPQNAETLISDIIQPELFLPYVVQRSAQLSAFVASGIMDVDGRSGTIWPVTIRC
jgi:hypothetical protein